MIAFGNSHLMIDVKNQLAVIGCHLLESRFLYPNPRETLEGNDHAPRDSRYELFSRIDAAIYNQIKDLVLNGEQNNL